MKFGEFILAGQRLIRIDTINWIDLSRIEELQVPIYHGSEMTLVENIQAIEVLMSLKPSAFESKRLRWKRHKWAFHNLVGHPLMQVLAFLRFYKLAMFVHDATVPVPEGSRQSSES